MARHDTSDQMIDDGSVCDRSDTSKEGLDLEEGEVDAYFFHHHILLWP